MSSRSVASTLGRVLGIALVAVCGHGATANAATVKVNGVVRCDNGAPVQGIYVASSNGGSKFATWTPMPFPGAARYSTTISTRLPIGHPTTGGVRRHRKKWASTNNAPYRRVGANRVFNVFCNGTGACSFPTEGQRTPTERGGAWPVHRGRAQRVEEVPRLLPAVVRQHRSVEMRPLRQVRIQGDGHADAVLHGGDAGNRAAGFGHVAFVKAIARSSTSVRHYDLQRRLRWDRRGHPLTVPDRANVPSSRASVRRGSPLDVQRLTDVTIGFFALARVRPWRHKSAASRHARSPAAPCSVPRDGAGVRQFGYWKYG